MDMTVLAVVVFVILMSPVLYQQWKRCERATFKLGYMAGRYAEHLDRPQPRTEAEWEQASLPPSPSEIRRLWDERWGLTKEKPRA